jgi:hypothetical protein
VVGLSFDYQVGPSMHLSLSLSADLSGVSAQVYNIVGFTCYSIFNGLFYYSPEVQHVRSRRTSGGPGATRGSIGLPLHRNTHGTTTANIIKCKQRMSSLRFMPSC